MDISQLVDNKQYPRLWPFLKYHVDMQFADVRCLLQLPQRNLTAGCNYAAAAVLFNLISGISVCLYDASLRAFESQAGRGKRFEALLLDYYPWSNELVPKDKAIKVLYKSSRNPLSHSLGLYKPNAEMRSSVDKFRLNPRRIKTIENRKSRPKWLPPTISRETHPFEIYKISIPSLYWGIYRLIESLIADRDQMEKAEVFFLQLYTAYDVKGLTMKLQRLRAMQRNTPQYIDLADGMKSKLIELLQSKDKLTQAQNQSLQHLWKDHIALTGCKNRAQP